MVTRVHKHGVYFWPKSSSRIHSFPTFIFSRSKFNASISVWHSCLGHPSYEIFHQFSLSMDISFSHSQLKYYFCNSCQINKSHKLSFSYSTISSSFPFKVVFSDVWISPVVLFDNYKYYVIFINHFTKYVWFYPLRKKSNVHSVFVTFKGLVEKYFSTTTKTLFTDNGWRIYSFTSFPRV